MKARTVALGKGEEDPPCDPGSELLQAGEGESSARTQLSGTAVWCSLYIAGMCTIKGYTGTM